MARAVHHPAAVVLPVLLVEGALDVDALGQQAPLVQVLGDDPDRGGVDVGELVARLDRGQTGLLRGIDGVVDLALRVGEGAVGREGAGDVGGEQRLHLDPGVEQDEVTVVQLAGVLDPVQRGGVVAGGADRVVADAVALVPRGEAEDALDPALAAAVGDGVGQVGDDGLEAVVGRLDRLAHLLDLPLVLGEAQVRQEVGELVVGLGERRPARSSRTSGPRRARGSGRGRRRGPAARSPRRSP